MKTIRVLILIATLLLVVCLSGLVTLAILPPAPTFTEKPDIPVNTPSVEDVILPLTEDAGQEYIDKIYFVGESTTSHFYKGGISDSHILVPESKTMTLGSDILKISVGSEGLTIPEAVKKANAEILIITLGVNNASNFKENQYKYFYGNLIRAIQKESPNTKIIIQSIFPVTKNYSDNSTIITNDAIDRNNKWGKELAFEYGLRYLDTQSILKDESGGLIEKYCNDEGIHLEAEAYTEIIYYIRTHAIE